MSDWCPHGHEVRSSADRDHTGYCRRCRQVTDAAYNSRRSAAMQLAVELERHGVEVTYAHVDRPTLAARIAAALQTPA